MEENKVTETSVEENKVASNQEEGAKAEGKKNFRGQKNSSQRGGRKFDKNKKERREPVVKEFEERVVAINRVSKTVKGGRRMKFSALVVIGNKKGKFGFSTGKSGEVPDAIKKAVDKAKRNTYVIHLTKAGSLTHEVIGEFGATKVFLKPAPEGTGIIAGGTVRAILELSGVRNVYSKVYGSRTPINAVRATINALNSLKSYKGVLELRKGGDSDVK